MKKLLSLAGLLLACLTPAAPVAQAAPQTQELASGSALFWHPSVNAAACGDTILVLPDRCEVITGGEDWPQLGVQVKGTTINVPDVLCREV